MDESVNSLQKENTTFILGIKINNVNYQTALETAKRLIDSSGKHYIVTPNPEMVMAARSDQLFKAILNKADLAIPDGQGLVVWSKFLKGGLNERVSGVDLLVGLASMAEEFGYTLFLLGAGKGVAEAAAGNLQADFPKLKIAGTYSGRGEEEFDDELRKVLHGKKIDILAVAFGHGKQEKWIYRNLPHIDVRLAIGVGGAFSYIAGEKKRAPLFLQKAGFEWLFRLANEPSRFKRQLALIPFSILFLRHLILRK